LGDLDGLLVDRHLRLGGACRGAAMKVMHIDLKQAHVFPDITPIPQRFHREFDICLNEVQDDTSDWVVSDAIAKHGVWEPMETTFLSSAFMAADPAKTLFLDLGSHIGWYSLLANTYDIPTIALDLNRQQLACLAQVIHGGVVLLNEWIDVDWQIPVLAAAASKLIVKMDIEGSEVDAVNGMWDQFKTKRISHCLMEVSPVFNGSYPDLLTRLIDLGYWCYVMPEKTTPPPVFKDAVRFLRRYCKPLHIMDQAARDSWISRQHQFDVILSLPESKWA
jgi:hypothetical protein